MSGQFIFIETQTFTKCFSRLATDRDLFVVQAKILSDPRVGNLIPGGSRIAENSRSFARPWVPGRRATTLLFR